MSLQVRELVAVEHGDGGLGEECVPPGEDAGTAHCALCGLAADEQAWACLGDELGVTMTMRTSDDLDPDEQPIVRELGTPCVLARLSDGALEPVVLAERLEVFEGDVTRLVREVRLVAEQQDWDLPGDEPDREEV